MGSTCQTATTIQSGGNPTLNLSGANNTVAVQGGSLCWLALACPCQPALDCTERQGMELLRCSLHPAADGAAAAAACRQLSHRVRPRRCHPPFLSVDSFNTVTNFNSNSTSTSTNVTNTYQTVNNYQTINSNNGNGASNVVAAQPQQVVVQQPVIVQQQQPAQQAVAPQQQAAATGVRAPAEEAGVSVTYKISNSYPLLAGNATTLLCLELPILMPPGKGWAGMQDSRAPLLPALGTVRSSLVSAQQAAGSWACTYASWGVGARHEPSPGVFFPRRALCVLCACCAWGACRDAGHAAGAELHGGGIQAPGMRVSALRDAKGIWAYRLVSMCPTLTKLTNRSNNAIAWSNT